MALQSRHLMRDEIGAVLGMGPSGVRKYLADLAGRVKVSVIDGEFAYRLAISAEEAQAYLASLVTSAPAPRPRPSMTLLAQAARDPSRHIHIMPDDVEFKPRMHRFTPQRDPLVAALFGAGRMEARA